MNEPRFGVRLPVNGPAASPETILACARDAERLGFDAVWAHDLTGWTRDSQRTAVYSGSIDMVTEQSEPIMFEPLATLAFVAGGTDRIRLGSSVICVPLRNPVLLAKQFASLDVLSGGRLIAGVGIGATGSGISDYEVVGVPREGRYERMDEYLQVMQTIWESADPSFSGRFVELPATEIRPRPVQMPLPVWVGGTGRRALELAAKHGTGWLPSWLDVDGYRTRVPLIESELTTYGRHPERFTIAKDCYVAIDEDPGRARDFSSRTIEVLLDGSEREARRTRQASMLIGPPEQIRDTIREYVEVGVTDFEMKFIYLSTAHLHAQMELFADTVADEFGPGSD